MYAARVLLAVDDEHRPPLHSFAVAARAACGQTNGRTDEHGTGIYVVDVIRFFTVAIAKGLNTAISPKPALEPASNVARIFFLGVRVRHNAFLPRDAMHPRY